ncbi:alpha-glucan family phosphorylase [Treponema sp. J25]|uniref:alpha-glucan family phosphorylase n=1 Tax=Treponema sp. J25 TaxID=2094121 RepID=UPI00104E73E6|nr:alpha-glucan family phosphorylase [Treponema sp. J25]TCW61483.1 alpha-glucan phosphorylase [Treponema sp. J25]
MNITTYTVKPKLPAPLQPLEELAHNLWLSWNFDAVMLFIRLDYDTWLHSQQNPARMLGMVSQERLEKMAQDDSYLAALKEVYNHFQRYKKGERWYRGSHRDVIAYFSMEYGLDVSLPIYSGGLGILSGDHMKTASDLGLPLVGVGLLYRQGYFKQYLNADGFQQESYPENDWYNMPVERKLKKDGKPLLISVDLAGRVTLAQIWEVKVGRNSIYLLDTNIEENAPDLRDITATLYGGDRETRIRQEILLGVGGIRALRALGINPAVAHMNEGHSAFLGLERIRELMEQEGLTFYEAKEALWPTNVFTTHTPVPAGNERFSIDLMEKYFRSWAEHMGLSWKEFLALGRENPDNEGEQFCMTVLALRLSAYCNGVARLHGRVSREMWKGLWPGLPVSEVPIGHITNGVHPRTWVSNNMVELLDRYFGPHFEEEPTDLSIWNRMDRISDEELWRTHERRRERLVAFARDRIRRQLERNGATDSRIQQAEDALSPYTLTIAFARRFATYKRGNLLLRDPERLLRLLKDSERPIQLIFAGKAHPHDLPGKDLIREIIHFAEKYDVTSKIVFLEDYDMTMAKYLTSGADLWLNTPRRPLEASGTSGMKAAMNGVLNCSILDGWWDEAYAPDIGWAIGRGEQYTDMELQDNVESRALYDLLEREIIPLFYQRGRDGLPREWIRRMKNCMRTIGQSMSSHRMLMEYSQNYYFPALKNYRRIRAGNYEESKSLAAYLQKLKLNWPQIAVLSMSSTARPVMQRGDSLTVSACIRLGNLQPEEVRVELYHGTVSNQGVIEEAQRDEMKPVQKEGDCYRFQVRVQCTQTGRQGHTVRILPKHPALVHPYLPGFIKWG